MKTVSLREFQLNANKILREGDFPILLTRYNIVVAQVMPNGSGEISQKQFDEVYAAVTKTPKKILKKIPEPVEAPVSLKQTEGSRGFERRCSIGLCNNLAVDMRDGYWYCKEHL